MSDYDFDFLCIGSGPAGQRAAVQAAKFGKRAAVIERAPEVGGVSVCTGTMPSKTFREAVLYFTGGTGSIHDRPHDAAARPTAAKLLDRVAHVIHRETEVVEDQLGRNRVEVLRGEGRFNDPHTVTVRSPHNGERAVTADKIIIAVGSKPAPVPGIEDGQGVIITSEGVLTLQVMPRTMTVVGGGVIGMEYASMFAALGVEVTLIDQRSRPLEFLDSEIVDELIHQMRNCNVTFRLGEAVERLEIADGSPKRAVAHLASGKRIVSDLLLFSVGRIGATDALNLPAAGLTVDECFRTSVPHIFAAGDVIGFPSLAATSSEQGRLAACQAFGVSAKPMSPHFPIGIYAIPEISMVGVPEHTLTEQKVPYEVGIARYREIARGQILGDDSGLFKMLFHRETRALLGVHIIGTGATELVHIGQAVLRLGAGLDYFLETVFNYPTLAECYKVAALDVYNKLSV